MDLAKIKELRERTGVGFGDCKKALLEADWDMDRAVDIIRLQSGAKAEKKADRTAAEGLLGLRVRDGAAALVEVNVETDFAARNPKFAEFVDHAVETVLERGADGIAEALEERRKALVQEIGENISVRRAARLRSEDGGAVAGYLHQDGRKGAVLALSVSGEALSASGEALSGGGEDAAIGRDIAMHITAMRPLVVAAEDVPEDVVARERALFEEQAGQSGKPQDIVDKMVAGRVRKFLAESSLLEQPFVKDTSINVGKLLKSAGANCERFARFEVGEGIEKRAEDFAEEVRKQIA